jgi:hypothetical protein
MLKFGDRFNKVSKRKKTIVISRYNESLEWLRKIKLPPEYSIVIYNKGNNTDFYLHPNVKRVIPLSNVGRCDHTYLYHVITDYKSLSDVVIFLPGCCNTPYKFDTMKRMLSEVESTEEGAFPIIQRWNNLKEDLNHFELTYWQSTTRENCVANPEHRLTPANIRPFGKWFEHFFGNRYVTVNQLWGVFSISKKDILQYPLSYYENLINEFGTSSNPEVGHYFERSWVAVFGPFRYTKFI